MQDFVSMLLEFTKEYESPTSFWRWSAYATISATLRNKLVLNQGLIKAYPNLYVVLLADSGSGKGAPIKLCVKLLNLARHTKVLAGSTSKEAILEYLHKAVPIAKTGVTLRGGQAIFVAEELAAFFIKDPSLIEFMTDLHDARDEPFERNLRSGSFVVEGLCVSMLAGSNEELLRDIYNNKAVYGGLLRRTMLIKPDDVRPSNSLMYVDVNKYDIKPLLESLKKIEELKGNATISEGGKKLYDAWYHELRALYLKLKDRSGVVAGMKTNVLKLALILAANEYTTEINENHLEEAIIQVGALKSNYEVYSMSSGQHDTSRIGGIVIQALWEAKGHKLKFNEILGMYWNEMSTEQLQEVLDKLVKVGFAQFVPNGVEPSYELTQKCIDKFTKAQEEKK